MANVYLILGAPGAVGCALIRRMITPGDVFIAQGDGNLTALAPLCKEHPGAIRTLAADLSSGESLRLFVEQLQNHFPTPTHLVVLPPQADSDWFNGMVAPATALCDAFVPLMATDGFGRVVVVLPPLSADPNAPCATEQRMAAGALEGLAQGIAAQYAPWGVTANCVALARPVTQQSETPSASPTDTPAPGALTNYPQDVAAALAFLCSEEAAAITGITLPIAGRSNPHA